MKNRIYRIYGTEYKEMTKRLLAASDLLPLLREKEHRMRTAGAGGRSFHIVLKPNLVTPQPAEFGGTTHPQVTAGVIEFLKENGYDDLTIMEGSWAGDSTQEAFTWCGYRDLSRIYGVPLVDTKAEPADTVDGAGMKLSVCRCAMEADFLINLPVLKGHCQTKMTCALKNMKGLIPDREKRRFHTLGLHRPIAHLNTVLRPDFIVTDQICGDPDFEEGGNPLTQNFVLASTDPVLTDAYACRVLGYRTEEVPYVVLAEKLGIGTASLEGLELVEVCGAGSKSQEMPAGNAEGLESEEKKIHRILDVQYAVEDADSCSDCYASLTAALMRLREEGLLEEFTASGGRFLIGQGFGQMTAEEMRKREAAGPVIGIGNCTAAASCHVPGCPADEEGICRAVRKLLDSCGQKPAQ